MKLRALVFDCEHPNTTIGVELDVDTPLDIEAAKKRNLPAAYLVRCEEMDKLRALGDLFVDRGMKNKTKSLWTLLEKAEKIPLIDGNYDSFRQLNRSIQALLKKAKESGKRALYFIGAKEHIFDKMWENSEKATKLELYAKNRRSRPSRPMEEFPDLPSWLIHELSQHCHTPPDLVERYVGVSQEAALTRQLIMLAAKVKRPILILGDTGTGKDVVARAVHEKSSRNIHPFVYVNCSAVQVTLFESELFGHVPGSFTNSIGPREGLWKAAGEGTLFLDEIGDMQLESQAKILNALEKGYIRPLGGDEQIKVNARIIAATNRDLFTMVGKGQFREDLYYRLRGFLIRTSALRNHAEDIPVLADCFWRRITKDFFRPLPQEIMDPLTTYRWPGNVRELKKVLEYLHGLFGSSNLTSDHLKAVFYLEGRDFIPQRSVQSRQNSITGGNPEHISSSLHHLKCAQEVLRSLEVRFEQMKTEGQPLDLSFKLGIYELESLCRHPSFFRNAYTAVWGTLATLYRYREQAQLNGNEAGALDRELAATFKLAQTSLAEEITSFMRELNV